MLKIISLVLLLLLYPLFLQWLHISDLRAVPLIIPYALGMLSIVIICSELITWLRRRRTGRE